jgi:hypothetical protein
MAWQFPQVLSSWIANSSTILFETDEFDAFNLRIDCLEFTLGLTGGCWFRKAGLQNILENSENVLTLDNSIEIRCSAIVESFRK